MPLVCRVNPAGAEIAERPTPRAIRGRRCATGGWRPPRTTGSAGACGYARTIPSAAAGRNVDPAECGSRRGRRSGRARTSERRIPETNVWSSPQQGGEGSLASGRPAGRAPPRRCATQPLAGERQPDAAAPPGVLMPGYGSELIARRIRALRTADEIDDENDQQDDHEDPDDPVARECNGHVRRPFVRVWTSQRPLRRPETAGTRARNASRVRSRDRRQRIASGCSRCSPRATRRAPDVTAPVSCQQPDPPVPGPVAWRLASLEPAPCRLPFIVHSASGAAD